MDAPSLRHSLLSCLTEGQKPQATQNTTEALPGSHVRKVHVRLNTCVQPGASVQPGSSASCSPGALVQLHGYIPQNSSVVQSYVGKQSKKSTGTALKPANYRKQSSAWEHIALLGGRVVLVKFTGPSCCSCSGLSNLVQISHCLHPMHTLSPSTLSVTSVPIGKPDLE